MEKIFLKEKPPDVSGGFIKGLGLPVRESIYKPAENYLANIKAVFGRILRVSVIGRKKSVFNGMD